MKTLRKVALATTVAMVAFAGINTPTKTITAEGQRHYDATHSKDVHSYAFESLEAKETLEEMILNDHKKAVEKQKDENKERIEVKAEEYRQRYTQFESDSYSFDEVVATADESTDSDETSDNSNNSTPTKTYVGNYDLTAYVATGSPCADGAYPQVGYTVASNDPSLWHKWIEIEGHGLFYVHDTGGMSSNVIDIFVGSYGEAIQFGCRNANVYIVEF